MSKVLLLVILVAIALAWSRSRGRRNQEQRAAGPVKAESMVTCVQCALNLPASEAVFDAAGTPFCCAAHLEARRARERR
jgi:hypothetical protein